MTVIWCDSVGAGEQTGTAEAMPGLGTSVMQMLWAQGAHSHLPQHSLGPKGFFLVASFSGNVLAVQLSVPVSSFWRS